LPNYIRTSISENGPTQNSQGIQKGSKGKRKIQCVFVKTYQNYRKSQGKARKMRDAVDMFIQSVDWKIGKFNLLPIAFGVTMSLLDVFMMGIAKMSKTGSISYGVALPMATLLYALEPYIFFKSLNYETMTIMNLTWDLTSDIMVTMVGLFWFRESIKGLRWMALGFAAVSLALFAYTEE
jgi:hypothetical protein